MNEEFDNWARTNMVDDTGYIEAYGRMEHAFTAGMKTGWEQCQREVVGITDKIGFAAHSRTDAQNCCAEIADAIASMEYKGAENDL